MEARNIEDLKRGLAMANGYSAAFSAACDDMEVVALCRQLYGWKQVKLERDSTIVRARPMSYLKPGGEQ